VLAAVAPRHTPDQHPAAVSTFRAAGQASA
jgi:hypothetical protein